MADMRTAPNLARTHGVWPCCPESKCVSHVCVCVCVAPGGPGLNIYEEQQLPKGESGVFFLLEGCRMDDREPLSITVPATATKPFSKAQEV